MTYFGQRQVGKSPREGLPDAIKTQLSSMHGEDHLCLFLPGIKRWHWQCWLPFRAWGRKPPKRVTRVGKNKKEVRCLWHLQDTPSAANCPPPNFLIWQRNKPSKATIFPFFCYKLLNLFLCCTLVHGLYYIMFFMLKYVIIKLFYNLEK